MRNVVRRRNTRGQALVEFVLIANVLLLLIYTIWQFGIAFTNYIQVTDAARAAARKAATYGADASEVASNRDTAYTQATATAQGAADVRPLTVTFTASPSFAAGNEVKATVSTPYTINVLGVGLWSGNLTSSTTMRVEKRKVTS
jgi:Flp pilus assembly protein TadG